MSYLITSADGDAVAQHHADPQWPQDRRLVTRCVRVMGRDTATYDLLIADGTSGNVPDQPSSIGYHESRALWYPSENPDPSGNTRLVAAWADIWPGVITNPTGTQSDPYKSKVVSASFATPAFYQDPKDPTVWVPDTGITPQKVATQGSPLPSGSPVVVLPFSISTEQQMAAIPASNQLFAVWFGGAQQGKYGTYVCDVTPTGELDLQRRARDHSWWRVYRLPSSGLLPFGAVPGANVKPYPVSSGLAWQLNLDVDAQAGYGLVVDQAADAAPQAAPQTPTNPSGSGSGLSSGLFDPISGLNSPNLQADINKRNSQLPTGPGVLNAHPSSPINSPNEQAAINKALRDPVTTQSRNPSSPSTHAPVTTSKRTVFGVTGKVGFGPFSVGSGNDIHQIAVTPDGEPINSTHWNVLNPIDGDGFDAPAETSGTYEPTGNSGPLPIPVFWRYDSSASHPFIGGTKPGLRRWETYSVLDTTTSKPQDDNNPNKVLHPEKDTDPNKDNNPQKDNDPSIDHGYKSVLPDKDQAPIIDRIKDPTGENAAKQTSNDYSYKSVLPDKDLYPEIDGLGSTYGGGFTVGGGPKTALGSIADAAAVGGEIGGATGNAGTGTRTRGTTSSATAKSYTFGGNVLLSGIQNTANQTEQVPNSDIGPTISIRRGYARSPLEIAVPGILGRPVPLNGPDPRGYTVGLSPAQLASYQSAIPIAGVISSAGDQTGGSWRYFSGSTPGSALYTGGIAEAGGFVLHPANTDIKDIQAGTGLPPHLPTTTFMAATPNAQFAVADPSMGGLPANGFTWGRDSTTSTTWNYVDGSGVSDFDPALKLDVSTQKAQSWGGDLVNGKDGTATQVPIANGDGTVTWGAPLGATGGGIYGDGSDGAHTVAGTETLTRDMLYTTLVVPNGTVLKTAGFRIFCSVSCTVAAGGTIQNNGGNASGITAGAAAPDGSIAGGSAGAAGHSQNTSTGVDGGPGVALSLCLGGTGGSGASVSVFVSPQNNGGAGGVATAPPAALGTIRAAPLAALGSGVTGGTGGGAGATQSNQAVTVTSGGGGGGAGALYIAAFAISNSGTISSNGGSGAAGTAVNGGGGAGAGEIGGGGGGGGGGRVTVQCGTYSGSDPVSSGGAAGASVGHGSFTENAAATAGAAGLVIKLVG